MQILIKQKDNPAPSPLESSVTIKGIVEHVQSLSDKPQILSSKIRDVTSKWKKLSSFRIIRCFVFLG